MLSKRVLAVAFVVAGLVMIWFAMSTGPSTRLPADVPTFPDASVVVVTLDTTRVDRFGCYGSTAGMTPFIDSLAERGIVFQRADSVAPITLPSHASILTGMLPTSHGVRNNGMFTLPDSVETMAEVFSREGYATGAFISAQVLTKRYGLDQGFDVYDDDLTLARRFGQTTVPARRGNVTLDSAVSWLQSVDGEQPVFMWLHLYDPHAPYDPPPEFRAKFPDDPYGAEIAFADDLVRRLADALEAAGRLDSTVLTVLADHGEALGEHGEQTHGMLLHQATIRVPWVLMPPGGRAKELRVLQPVSIVDLAPLLTAMVEVDAPNGEDSDGTVVFGTGASGEERSIYSEAMLPMYQYGWAPLRGLRVGAWQLVAGIRDELFNLDQDPRELADVADAEPMQLEFMDERVAAIETGDTTLQMDAATQMSPSEREALEALGYLATTATARRNPPDPRDLVRGHVFVEASRSLMAAGRFDEALQGIDQMLADDPENLAALSLKGQILQHLGRLDQAEEVFKRGLELDPKNSEVYVGLSRIELARGRFDKVVELAQLGKDTRSPFGTFHAMEARALFALGRPDDASAVVEDGLALNHNDADLLMVRALKKAQEGHHAEAEADLRLAVNATPFHRAARQTLGKLLQDQGQLQEATEVYKELLRIQPGDADALLAIGSIQMLTDVAEALPYLEEASRVAPGRREVLTKLGIAYIQANRLPEAEAALRRAVSLDPEEPLIRNNLAIVLIRQQSYDEAIEEIEVILAAEPTFYQARNNLAIALAEQGNMDGAEREVRRALADNPEFLDTRLTLATVLNLKGEITEEHRHLEIAHEAAPQRNDVRLRLAVASAKLGRCEQSLDLFGSDVQQDRAMPPAGHLYAATCLEKLGRVKEALRHYEEAARSSPPGHQRVEAQEGVSRLSMQLGTK